ncbi:MAG: hypothetical protein RLZZ467_579, partial [Gemmatimonadota bacterium]
QQLVDDRVDERVGVVALGLVA